MKAVLALPMALLLALSVAASAVREHIESCELFVI